MTTQKPTWIPLLVLLAVAVLALFTDLPGTIPTEGIDTGDTAWLIVASGLVLLMTPGLAYFYGGMVNHKNVISTMLQSFIAMGVISVIWVIFGFSLAFGDSIGGWIGDPTTFFMFNHVFDHKLSLGSSDQIKFTIPFALFAFFQMKFAVITPALISGALAERINFKAYVLFMVLFCICVYSPLAHWTWHPDGFLFNLGVLDFAGGTVVHMSAGWAALAGALYLRRRKSHIEYNILPPANIPYVLLGTALLWFGWFGFNAGSALGANSLSVTAFATTHIAAASAGLSWILFDVTRGKKVSALGFCIGAVVGLVAITPAAGFVTLPVAIFIGVIAALVSNIIAHWRASSNLDDTLDVFPCHGVGGMMGMLMTGIFATSAVNSAVAGNGLFYGETDLFVKHILALAIVSAFAFGVSYILLIVTDKIIPLRVNEEEERLGLDISQHDESISE
ncbi:ammonium transporter [Aquirufa nivalisilvae]|uniref:ammonium transporter n=1 Tax=Aquirufa nivalisilvae TaxID=2516557 RepID=UPI002E75B14B|nr:ammonium transporter [Aquirufa nivalisilvae]MCZ2480138.1 ammonium transporter [Aquirufa nivalisilvae]MCZ2482467.1 ammonium transporter [Aquirufa nivalisilvae]